MRILIYDDYTAGAEPRDANELAQADVNRALVAALAVDFGRLNAHDVRVAAPGEGLSDIDWAEGVILLAPETDDRLTDLAEQAERHDAVLLGPNAAAIRLTSDRMGLALALGEAGLPVPRTWAIDFGRDDLLRRVVSRLGWPVVVKPVIGAGGRGVRLVSTADALPEALATVRAIAPGSSFLLQEHVPGFAVGVGIVVANGEARPLGLWGAMLCEPPAMIVERCATPFEYSGVEAAVELAALAAVAIPGLKGYVEVDLVLAEAVLAEAGAIIIEVAARPTLGSLALRRSCQFNLAEVMVEATIHGRLPDTRFWPPSLPVLADLRDPAAALSAAMPL